MTSQQFYQRLRFKIKILTPVHIASGTCLIENRDYYVDKNNLLRRIDYPGLLASIPGDVLPQTLQQIKTDGIRSLLPRPRKKAEKVRIEEDWKQALRQRVGMEAAVPEEEEESEPQELESLLQQAELYSTSSNLVKDDKGNRIQAMAMESGLHSFLPGSSLKGAIRTACYINTILQQPDRLNRMRFTWTSNPIEADYPLDREITGLERNHLGKDIFRRLWVKDSNYLDPAESVDLFQLRIMNIAGDGDGPPSKLMWKKGNKRNVASYREADPIYWEMLRPEIEFSTEIIIENRELYGDEFEGVALELDQGNLMHALNVFAKVIAEHEIKYAEKFQIPYLRDFYRELAGKCDEALASGDSAYLPIGSGLPWHAKTVGNLLETTSLEKIRRHFYRYMGKFIYLPLKTSFHGMRLRRGQLGGKPIRPEKLKAVEPFPKTRHFVFIDGQPAYPPGWLCLQLQ